MNVALLYIAFVCVTDLIALLWFLFLFFSFRMEPQQSSVVLNWRNIFLTVFFGWLLSIGGRTANWGEVFRFWRSSTTVLVALVAWMCISGRIFDPPDREPTWLLKYSANLIGWVLFAMVLVVWAHGID